jgi:hypothetical protein
MIRRASLCAALLGVFLVSTHSTEMKAEPEAGAEFDF